MRLYLAAPWVDKDKMEDLATQFEANGHTITHRWWDVEVTEDLDLVQQASRDLTGVGSCEVLVLFNTSKSEGKAIEQGYALALGIPIIAVKGSSDSNNVFHHLPKYRWVETLDDVLKDLESIQWWRQHNNEWQRNMYTTASAFQYPKVQSFETR